MEEVNIDQVSESQPKQSKNELLKGKLLSVRRTLTSFVKERIPSPQQTASAIAAAMTLIASNSPFADAIGGRGEEAGISSGVKGCVDELSETELRELRKEMEGLVDTRTLPQQNVPEKTSTAIRHGKIQKEYQPIPLSQEKYPEHDKINFEDASQILDRWRNIHSGERMEYEEVLSSTSFDAIVIGESHMGSLGQYENVVRLIEKGVRPSVVGLELVDEQTPEGRELVQGMNEGTLSLEDAQWKYRYDSKPLLGFLRDKQIPIAGIEPIERDSEWWHGGPKRFKGITDWAVEQVKTGEVPLVYVGDGHTSRLGLERGEIHGGRKQEGWRLESSYLLKERLESEGLKPLTVHLASKTMLADETDSLFARLYRDLRPEDRKRFMEDAPFLYEEIVRPSKDEECFVKMGENEYNSVFYDREKPYIAPPKSAWVSAQKFLEENYPEEFSRYTLNKTVIGASIGFSLAGKSDEIIWVSEDNGEVVKAIFPSK